MTETELRKRCGLKSNELINSNRGALDIFSVKDGMVTIGVVATGRVFNEPVQSVIAKMFNVKKQTKLVWILYQYITKEGWLLLFNKKKIKNKNKK